MRRQSTQADSFDLFLDTICNTFGGIIFLAILVAILVQTRSILEHPEQSDQSSHSPQELRELTVQLASAEATVQTLTRELERLPEVRPTPESSEYFEIKSRVAMVQEEIRQKYEESDSKSKELSDLINSNEILGKENQEIPERLKSLTEMVSKEQAAVSEIIDTRQTTLRLPRERESAAFSDLALLQGNLIFVAGEFNDVVDSFDGPHVETKAVLGGYKVLPKNGQGIDCKNAQTDSFISQMRRQGHIVTLAVWPDSYQVFQELKPKLVSAGVRYQIWLQLPDEDLTVSIGSGVNSRAQ